jgi:hypothetical protein
MFADSDPKKLFEETDVSIRRPENQQDKRGGIHDEVFACIMHKGVCQCENANSTSCTNSNCNSEAAGKWKEEGGKAPNETVVFIFLQQEAKIYDYNSRSFPLFSLLHRSLSFSDPSLVT